MGQLIEDLPFSEYLRSPAISVHQAQHVLKSPAHFMWHRTNSTPPNPAQALGTLVHALVMERHKVIEEYTVETIDRRTKAGKARAEEIERQGLIAVSEETMTTATSMANAVLSHDVAWALFQEGTPEVSMFWEDPDTGLQCRGRADWIPSGHSVLVDLKTAADGSYEGFSKAAANFNYDMQAAHYLNGSRECGLERDHFVFVVVENVPPHAVSLFVPDREMMQSGKVKMRRALGTLRECFDSGVWPGYPQEVQVLTLPNWARRRDGK